MSKRITLTIDDELHAILIEFSVIIKKPVTTTAYDLLDFSRDNMKRVIRSHRRSQLGKPF